MNKYLLFLVIILTSLSPLFAQYEENWCDCPKTSTTGVTPDTAFVFSSKQVIVICGNKNQSNNPPTFSEFVLAECGEDDVIDYWETTSRVEQKSDSVLVEAMISMPYGKDFEYKLVVWKIEKLYFKGLQIQRDRVINKQVPKYSPEEISLVLKEYDTAKYFPNDEKILNLMDKLFVATISGDSNARKDFLEFRIKKGPLESDFEEAYNNLSAKLSAWDKEK
jgi:hypothetical protein